MKIKTLKLLEQENPSSYLNRKTFLVTSTGNPFQLLEQDKSLDYLSRNKKVYKLLLSRNEIRNDLLLKKKKIKK